MSAGRRATRSSYNRRTARPAPVATAAAHCEPGVRRDPSAAPNSSSASGLPCASSTTSRRTRAGRWAKRSAEQVQRRLAPERRDDQLAPARPTREATRPGPGRTQQADPAVGEPAADEADDRGGGLVEPVHVVHDHEERRRGRCPAEGGQGGVEDRQPVGGGTGREPQGDLEGGSPRGGQLLDVVAQRTDQLVQAREADVSLVLHPATPDDPGAVRRGRPDRGIEERRLPDPGITGEEQGTAAGDGPAHEVVEDGELGGAPDQPCCLHVEVDHDVALQGSTPSVSRLPSRDPGGSGRAPRW